LQTHAAPLYTKPMTETTPTPTPKFDIEQFRELIAEKKAMTGDQSLPA